MAKLDFDYNGVKDNILPAIESTIKALDNCYNASNFDAAEFNSLLVSAREQIVSTKSLVQGLYDWLNSSNELVKNAELKLNDDANSIQLMTIEKRENWIIDK